jgi:hypothetical protein
MGGEVVKKLRKDSDKSLEPTRVPEDFEPQVIDETNDGNECIVITGVRPPQERQNVNSKGRG